MLGLQNEREWAAFCAKCAAGPNSPPTSAFASNPAQRESRRLRAP